MKRTKSLPRGRPRLLDRQKALEAALELFWRHGYEGTSLAELTAAMRTTPPSLYAAFGSKEQLYREAVDLYVATHGGFPARALAEEPSARSAMARILHNAIVVYAGGRKPRGCMLATGALTCAAEHRNLTDALALQRRDAVAAIKSRFDRAVEQGELSATADTAGLAAFYAAVIQGLSIQARDGVDPEVLESIAKVALDAWPALATHA